MGHDHANGRRCVPLPAQFGQPWSTPWPTLRADGSIVPDGPTCGQIVLRGVPKPGTLGGLARQRPNLMDDLGAGLLPGPDFGTILAAHFPQGAQADPTVVTYSRDGDTAIVARYEDAAEDGGSRPGAQARGHRGCGGQGPR